MNQRARLRERARVRGRAKKMKFTNLTNFPKTCTMANVDGTRTSGTAVGLEHTQEGQCVHVRHVVTCSLGFTDVVHSMVPEHKVSMQD